MTDPATGPAGMAAVLFDMDGTLLDSEPLWDRVMADLAAHHGGRVSEAARQAMLGQGDAESMAIFYRDLGITEPDREGDRRFLAERMVAMFATELRWQPGAAELVAQVRRAQVPAALVTSTGRRLVEAALASTLGRDTFDVLVCGDEVTMPKPHPEPYLTAARRLGVPVSRCVAIEDSPTGIASASTAGAVVVGVPGAAPLAGLDGAHLVSSLVEVDVAYLARLVKQRVPGR